MRVVKIFSLVMAVFFTAGCVSTYQAKVDFDRNTKIDTSSYKTFAWLKEEKILAAPVDLNPVMKTRLDEAIEKAFIAKGYQLVSTSDAADFTISYTLGSRDKVRVDSFPATYRTAFGLGWGRGFYSGFGFGNESHVRNYTEGKLAIDVFDTKTKEPVWHGWAVKRISSKHQENPGRSIQPVVEQVVNQFN